ncbi:MAG TPA: zf-HC2 domain-containing protein [Thermoanaerobaculia bacterium]|nr:zf-HC2 domain-containing protein [Thermoanaerobaculia bacterium]
MTVDDTEALRRAFTTPGGTAPRPEDCPSPETIWEAVHGELSPRALRDVVEHTATCAACAEEWRLAVEIQKEAEPRAGAAPSSPLAAARMPERSERSPRSSHSPRVPRSARRAVLALAPIAAILLLVVGLPGVFSPSAPVYRGETRVVPLLAAGKSLPRGHCQIAWSGPKGATYNLELRDANGSAFFSVYGLKETHYLVPEPRLSAIASGAPIEGRITALLAGQAPGRSPPFTFTLH